jgi:hypothetical protein
MGSVSAGQTTADGPQLKVDNMNSRSTSLAAAALTLVLGVLLAGSATAQLRAARGNRVPVRVRRNDDGGCRDRVTQLRRVDVDRRLGRPVVERVLQLGLRRRRKSR